MANYCPNCGNQVNNGDSFCSSCGSSLSGGSSYTQNTTSSTSVGDILGTLVAVSLVGGLTRDLYYYQGRYFLDPYCRRPFRGARILGHHPMHHPPMMGVPRGGMHHSPRMGAPRGGMGRPGGGSPRGGMGRPGGGAPRDGMGGRPGGHR